MIPSGMGKLLQWLYPLIKTVDAEELPKRFRAKWAVPGFLYWRKYCSKHPDFSIDDVMRVTSPKPMSDQVLAAYQAPFPDQTYMQGARQFPTLVPVFLNEPEVPENKAAWRVLRKFDKPFMCAFADNDPVTAGGDKKFLQQMPGCRGVNHRTIANAGHFVQEDQPQACVQAILDIISHQA